MTKILFAKFFLAGRGRLKEGDTVDLAHLFWMCEKVQKFRISDSSPTPDRKISNVTSLFLIDSELTREI